MTSEIMSLFICSPLEVCC